MKKEIFLVLACPTEDFKEWAKKGRKCSSMVYRCNCSPVWATTTKETAIFDCKCHNRVNMDNLIYFMLPIKLFK